MVGRSVHIVCVFSLGLGLARDMLRATVEASLTPLKRLGSLPSTVHDDFPGEFSVYGRDAFA